MKKLKRKIVGGLILAGSVLLSLGVISHINKDFSFDSLPASIDYQVAPPIIVLDAGHGESG